MLFWFCNFYPFFDNLCFWPLNPHVVLVRSLFFIAYPIDVEVVKQNMDAWHLFKDSGILSTIPAKNQDPGNLGALCVCVCCRHFHRSNSRLLVVWSLSLPNLMSLLRIYSALGEIRPHWVTQKGAYPTWGRRCVSCLPSNTNKTCCVPASLD